MEKKIPKEFLEFGSGNKYNGNFKHLTKDCSSCSVYITINNQKRCYWGVAWKVLVETEKPRKCEFHNQQGPRERYYNGHLEYMKRTGFNPLHPAEKLPQSKIPSSYMDAIGRRDKI
jgi:hypothetical protein